MRDISRYGLVYMDESGVNQYLYLESGKAPSSREILANSGRKIERISAVAAKCGKNMIAPKIIQEFVLQSCSKSGCKTYLFLS